MGGAAAGAGRSCLPTSSVSGDREKARAASSPCPAHGNEGMTPPPAAVRRRLFYRPVSSRPARLRGCSIVDALAESPVAGTKALEPSMTPEPRAMEPVAEEQQEDTHSVLRALHEARRGRFGEVARRHRN